MLKSLRAPREDGLFAVFGPFSTDSIFSPTQSVWVGWGGVGGGEGWGGWVGGGFLRSCFAPGLVLLVPVLMCYLEDLHFVHCLPGEDPVLDIVLLAKR